MKVRLAAQMQSLAMAIANADPNGFQTSATLVSHPEAKKLKACDHHAISALTVLYKIGKLERFRTASGKTRYGYELPASVREALRLRAPKPESLPAPTVPTDIQVTVNKATGTLNVEYRGLRLAISIVE